MNVQVRTVTVNIFFISQIKVTIMSGIDFTRLPLFIYKLVSTLPYTRKRVLVIVVTRKLKRTIVAVVKCERNVLYFIHAYFTSVLNSCYWAIQKSVVI